MVDIAKNVASQREAHVRLLAGLEFDMPETAQFLLGARPFMADQLPDVELRHLVSFAFAGIGNRHGGQGRFAVGRRGDLYRAVFKYCIG